MANRAASESIKVSAAAIVATLNASGGWDSFLIKTPAGEVDVEETKRAFGRALSTHLREIGVIKQGGFGRPAGATVDFMNIHLASFFSFSKLAKGVPGASVALTELVWTVVMDMGVPPAEIDKARRIIRECMDRADSPFIVEAGARKFDGSTVRLKTPPAVLAPVAFRPWGDAAPAPVAPAPAAPAPVAESAKGKGKGKGK